MSGGIVKFQPFRPHIDADFWAQLSDRKAREWKLDESPIPIDGYFELDRKEPGLFIIPKQEASRTHPGFILQGQLKNYNTLESFHDASSSKELFQSLAEEIWQKVDSGHALSHPNEISTFLLVSFADLKKYRYAFMTGFPCFAFPTPLRYEPLAPPPPPCFALAQPQQHYFILRQREAEDATKANFDCLCLSAIPTLELGPRIFFAYMDPCAAVDGAFGWPLRQLLLLLHKYYAGARLSFVAVRSICHVSGLMKVSNYTCFSVLLPMAPFSRAFFQAVTGWTTDPKGRVLSKLFDLGPMMGPTQLADSAIGLNLELMKWRMAPELDLGCLCDKKILLLGAGTLGCHVSRVLLSWGMTDLTLIDSGCVSYSNPVRQSLYDHADAVEGLPKAEAAAARIRKIHPTAGLRFEIPMPGHPMADAQPLLDTYSLIQRSDVVFLLTDSRESRWLPTLLGSFLRKIVMTIALDFNSLLVLRHGVYDSDAFSFKPLGCYFCPDVVSPSNSTRGRALDQQCTISRPGLSMIASALGVELLVSLLQPHSSTISSGPLPHQIRGRLDSFSFWKGDGESHEKCPACSPHIMRVMRQKLGLEPCRGGELLSWISHIMSHMEELESICGLDLIEADMQKLLLDSGHQDMEALLEEF